MCVGRDSSSCCRQELSSSCCRDSDRMRRAAGARSRALHRRGTAAGDSAPATPPPDVVARAARRRQLPHGAADAVGRRQRRPAVGPPAAPPRPLPVPRAAALTAARERDQRIGLGRSRGPAGGDAGGRRGGRARWDRDFPLVLYDPSNQATRLVPTVLPRLQTRHKYTGNNRYINISMACPAFRVQKIVLLKDSDSDDSDRCLSVLSLKCSNDRCFYSCQGSTWQSESHEATWRAAS
jgi:hypothetical protein